MTRCHLWLITLEMEAKVMLKAQQGPRFKLSKATPSEPLYLYVTESELQEWLNGDPETKF